MTFELPDTDRLLAGFNPNYVSRGRRYFRDQRVVKFSTEELGGSLVIIGRVRGSGLHLYEISVRTDDGLVEGSCTCPVAWNCKHVVAVLIAAASGEACLSPARAESYPLPDADEEESHSPETDNRLLYLLDLAPAGNTLIMRPFRTRLTNEGAYGILSPFRPSRVWEPFPPRYLLKTDIAILRNLIPASSLSEFPDGIPFPPDAVPLLERMIGSGRCHWLYVANPPLSLGDPCRAVASWELETDGSQRLVLKADGKLLIAPALSPPWYIDTTDHIAGPLTSDLPEPLLAELSIQPFIASEKVDDVLADWQRRFPGAPFERPRRLAVHQLPPTRPAPVLYLNSAEVNNNGVREKQPAARLSFDYAGHAVPWPGKGTEQVVAGGTIVRLNRDYEFEEDTALRLSDRGLCPLFASEEIFTAPSEHPIAWVLPHGGREVETWLKLQTDLPTLEAEGWRVSISDDFNYKAVAPDAWYGDIEASDRQWFDLELGIEIDGERISLLPMLLEWIEQVPAGALSRLLEDSPEHDGLPIRLDDRRIVYLPMVRLKGILTILVELFDPEVRLKDGRLSLPAVRAGELPLLERNDWNWSGGDELRRLGRRLHAFSGIVEVPPPTGFNTSLRDYQRAGLDWLQFLREFGLGGILADDMGLGKTVQTLAHLMVEKESGRLDRPALVVAPTSLMFNWRAEAARFAPALKVLTLHGPDRTQHFCDIKDFDLVLTTYPLVTRDIDTLSECDFHLLILDEAQAIKNPRAKVSQHVRELSARHRLCLTGTPMENHLGELWSVFDFLLPGLLGNERQFRRLFRNAIERQGDDERRAALARRIHPFFLRRTKVEVAPELPPKSEMLRIAALEGAQRDLYETVRLAMHGKVRKALSEQGLDRSRIVVLDALLKLRQVCCDPRLLKGTRTGRAGSAKLRMLMELLPEMLEEGRRVLLFSQFTSMLTLIEEELGKRRIDYVKLTGKTRDRATPVERFQSGEVPLFLISLKAGGTGLNLTAADTVIHYDPWWNPAVEDQATDRAHRIGQQNKVFVYRLITEGSVEEKIARMQEEKRGLVEALFGVSGPKALEAEDLEALFEPLG